MNAQPTRPITVRAPGKLFLTGEYAVLFGARAIVQAVDRYVEVTARLVPDSSLAVEVESLGATLPTLVATWQNHAQTDVESDSQNRRRNIAQSKEHNRRLNFDQPQKEHQLVIALLDALCSARVLVPEVGGLRLTIDSRQLFHAGNKLGLGSSAAVSHAVIEAVRLCVVEQTGAPCELPQDFVFDVHQAFQHGKGSGADVAAGVLGGTFWYRRADGENQFEACAVELPARVHHSFIWVGKPASTADALMTLSDFQRQHSRNFAHALAPLKALAERVADAALGDQAEHFVRDCEAYGHNLSEFGRTVGVDIVSEAHRSLRDVAMRYAVTYKPSGAGNGDFGVAYSLDINKLHEFEQAAVDLGFAPVPLGQGRACHRI